MSSRVLRFLRDTRDAVVVLRLLVLAGVAMLGLSEPPARPGPFWALVAAYGASNLLYMASGAARFLSARVRCGVFVLDVAAVSALIVLRGANVPEFILAYFTLVLMAAVAQGVGSAALNAVVVCTVFVAVSLWGSEPLRILEFRTLAPCAFFLVVAVFMSQFAEWGREHARARAHAEDERRVLTAAMEDRTRALSRSVDELDDTRRRLAAADRLATIGMIAAGVVHDIRNPVAALTAALEDARAALAEAPPPAPDDEGAAILASAVADACAACEHLHRLARDLGGVARTTPAAPVAVTCRDALEGAARLLHHRARPPLSIRVDAEGRAAAFADPGRLQQVLLNLGSNGLDAMDGRAGVLTLAAEEGEPGWVRLRVSDTGIGMSASTAAKVLAGFFTTKEAGRGTGLGLHLVREIVDAHGAHIRLESEPGSGTTFFIDWPAAPPPEPKGADHDGDDGIEAGDRGAGEGVLEDRAADRGRRGGHPSRSRADVPA